MKGKTLLRRMGHTVLDTVLPPRCLACPDLTETPMGLCGACWREVHFLAGHVCDCCGASVPTATATTGRIICNDCDRNPPIWDRGRAAVAYEGVGRRITMAFKHADRLDTAPSLARWMTGAGATILGDDTALLVPIPIHWSKLIRRRYNQAAVLALAVQKRTGLECCPDALRRTRATPELKGKTRDERRDIQNGSMESHPRHAHKFTDRTVILIDDVMTTGATLATATNICRTAGARQINVLTLARVARQE